MSVMIRLKRLGGKKDPFYRIVAINKYQRRDGKVLEILGHYDPKERSESLSVRKERVDHWVKRGAKVSPTVVSLIKKSKA